MSVNAKNAQARGSSAGLFVMRAVFPVFFVVFALFVQAALPGENEGGGAGMASGGEGKQAEEAAFAVRDVQADEAGGKADASGGKAGGAGRAKDAVKSAIEAEGKAQAEELEHGARQIFHNLLQEKAEEIEHDTNFFIRLGIAAAIVIFQIFLIWLTFYFAKQLRCKVEDFGSRKFKALKLKNITLLEPKHMIQVLFFLINVVRLIVLVMELVIIVPVIFSLFEATKNLASVLFGYILTPLKNFGLGFIKYIPNLITIIIILMITRYILRALKFFATQIELKKLVIPGFYPEWASPTFNILRVLVFAFTIAFIYPNLPNSESDIFKGVSVLVGVLFSLGSSTVIGNLISGIVMTYMRPFQQGDRITINNITGFVLERGPMVTRVRTHKNEIVSFPNQMIMSNSVTNYSLSSQAPLHLAGLIMHADITMGYDVPWQKVHEILLNAASKTEHTEKDPPPFVNQTRLDDFYCWYEINVYTKKPELLPSTYSNLYKNIQNGFAENGISMYAPHFEVHQRVDKI